MAPIEFIETTFFTKVITELLEDSDYANLQSALAADPEAGCLIRGGGGLRKLRWLLSSKGKGKRAGLRIIYHLSSERRILMIYAYEKSKKSDLTWRQLKVFKDYLQEGFL